MAEPYYFDTCTLPTNPWHARYGSPSPLGVSWVAEEEAYNFAIYSKHATEVRLEFFSEEDLFTPIKVSKLGARNHKSGPIWHIRIPESQIAQAKYYAYRIDGPPPAGKFERHQFDGQKLLLDPYARDVYFPDSFDRQAAILPGDNVGHAPLSVLPTPVETFDWEGDRPVRHGSDLILYELHVKGFTQNDPHVPPEHRGTFLGVIEKIPYLKDLGVTAVELMPVFQFDPQEGNYWGYMPLSFFAPHEAYATASADVDLHSEFREMVKQLHRANIEVILDVVYNHTAEGDERGPTYNFKGIDASTYYLMTDKGDQAFANYSGTGNTLHTANRATRRLIVDSLRYWVKEMHVDGFRFDLASIFTRDSTGELCASDPPIFGQIAADPDLRGIRLIAEPWDIGAYQLGSGFPGTQWMQWNDKYRRALQGIVRGDYGMVPEVMTRVHGSTDLFPDSTPHALRPFQSINYITSHDTFTLYDLVSYNAPHNSANEHAEQNLGNDLSWNCGCEGDSELVNEILNLRMKQAKNLFCLLMFSAGTPMFRMGDEFLQTQHGNSNPYNQDNETSWLDWSRKDRFRDFYHFCKSLIAFRKRHTTLAPYRFWHDTVHWYGAEHTPNLSRESRQIAYSLHGSPTDPFDFYIMVNCSPNAATFGVFERSAGDWRRIVDTSDATDRCFTDFDVAPIVDSPFYEVEGRSVVMLLSAK
jgi:isoamylase